MEKISHHARGRLPDNSPNLIDIHVGNRIKLRRQNLKPSQNTLAQMLGISFQQIQKYEKGLNRIGASRLFDFSCALNVSTDFFFTDMSDNVKNASPANISGKMNSLPMQSLEDPLESKESLELIRDYYKFKSHNPKASEHLKSLIHQLSLSPLIKSSQT